MGRGSSGMNGVSRYPGGKVDPGDIGGEQEMVVQRGALENEVDEVLTAARNLYDEYGSDGLVQSLVTADIGGKSSGTLAYYDGYNIGVNNAYFDSKAMNAAYDASGDFHPSRGGKPALEAVASHEFGHALTDIAAQKMGAKDLHAAADRIVNEARKTTGDKGVVIMASKISRYATHSNAEAVAEAFADVYCNGSKAKSQSQAIVNVLNSYVKGR